MALTEKQKIGAKTLAQFAFVLLYGGARSGKTFLTIYFIIVNCLSNPGARWLIARKYATDIRASVWQDTLPKVLSMLDLHQGKDFMQIENGMILTFKNHARIICGGLDDKERVDKILGQEYFGIYLNESQDIPYSTVKTLLTRLAQKVEVWVKNAKGEDVKAVAQNRLFADLNPTSINHWTYKMFVLKQNPETGDSIPFAEKYGYVQMNPADNQANLPPGYIDSFLDVLKGNARNRYLLGEFTTDDDLRVFTPRGQYQWPEFIDWAKDRWNEVKLVGGLDLGFQDADAFVILAYIDGDENVWLVWEHKARRQDINQLVTAIRDGIEWARKEIPNREKNFDIYADTATIRHGKEGDSKKSMSMLAHDYGLPVRPAYKRDKRTAIEHLQSIVNEGSLHIPRSGVFFEEAEVTVWTRNEDGSIIREIDDDIYHPDMMDAILYPIRFLTAYGNSAMIGGGEPPPVDQVTQTPLLDMSNVEAMKKMMNRDGEVF